MVDATGKECYRGFALVFRGIMMGWMDWTLDRWMEDRHGTRFRHGVCVSLGFVCVRAIDIHRLRVSL